MYGLRPDYLNPDIIDAYALKEKKKCWFVLDGEDWWVLDMCEVLNVHAQFFRRVFSFLLNPLESFVIDNNIEVLEEFPVGNVAVSKDLCTCAHYDRDFSWAFALWYRGKIPTFKKRKGEMVEA